MPAHDSSGRFGTTALEEFEPLHLVFEVADRLVETVLGLLGGLFAQLCELGGGALNVHASAREPIGEISPDQATVPTETVDGFIDPSVEAANLVEVVRLFVLGDLAYALRVERVRSVIDLQLEPTGRTRLGYVGLKGVQLGVGAAARHAADEQRHERG